MVLINIEFDNPRKAYRAGDLVTGACVIDVSDQPLAVTGLRLKFSGKAVVGFSRSTGGKHRSHYFTKEHYFRHEASLLQSSVTETTLTPGWHEFPFTFQLESNIPSSFEGSCGFIRYAVKATLDMGRMKSTNVKCHYNVFRPMELDMRTNYPIDNQAEKSLCCGCCAYGSLVARAWLSRRGFVPGEAVPLYATINNDSNCRVKQTYFTIEQVTHYFAMGKEEVIHKKLEPPVPAMARPAIPAGGTDTWSGEHTIVIPITPPTGLLGCNIITTEHRLVLHVMPAGPALRLTVPLDIIIGTELLTDNASDRQQAPESSHAIRSEQLDYENDNQGGEFDENARDGHYQDSQSRQYDSWASQHEHYDTSGRQHGQHDTSVSQGKQYDPSVSQARQLDSPVSQSRQFDSSVIQDRQCNSSVGQHRQYDTSVSQGRHLDSPVSQSRQFDSSISHFSMSVSQDRQSSSSVNQDRRFVSPVSQGRHFDSAVSQDRQSDYRSAQV